MNGGQLSIDLHLGQTTLRSFVKLHVGPREVLLVVVRC